MCAGNAILGAIGIGIEIVEAQMTGRELPERATTFKTGDRMLGNAAFPIAVHDVFGGFRVRGDSAWGLLLVHAQQRGMRAHEQGLRVLRRQLMHANLFGN